MKYNIQGFQIYAKYVDTVEGFPNNPKDTMSHNHYRVTLKRGGKCQTFSFYGSQHDYEQGKKELDKTGLRDCMYSFFSDALSGRQSFQDFASEFGYDADSMTAHKMWLACQRSDQKVRSFDLSEDDIVDLIIMLQT